jgi:hypothetical protein
MNNPKIMLEHEIDEIQIFPGEMLTVWLHSYGRHEEKREAVQIELRVHPGQYGKREIFISDKIGTVTIHQDFADWEPMLTSGGKS